MSHTLLVVFAHPDDETFGTGGIFAKYHAEGVRTVLACMTDGDAGRTSGQDADTPEALARQRRAELLRASSVLGVDCVEPFAFPDGKLEEVERSELVERTVATIRRHRPDVIVTFGPEGAPTEHRDHKICSRIATEAFERAGDTAAFPDAGSVHMAARLYYLTWPDDPSSTIFARFKVIGVPITARIDINRFMDDKRQAFVEHETQKEHRETFNAVIENHECFGLAAGTPQPSDIVTDLFQGL